MLLRSGFYVFGESRGHDFTSSKIHAVVYDEELRQKGLFRPMTIHDHQARTQDHAEQRARLELSKRLMDANRISAVVQDHVDPETGAVWSIDTVATVTWDDAGLLEAPRHIVKRTFTRSREGGTMTRLELTPLNAIVLGEVQYIPPKPPSNRSNQASTQAAGPSPRYSPTLWAPGDTGLPFRT
jgi:prophage tail gpP-like protein